MTENIGRNFRGGRDPQYITCKQCGTHVESQEEMFDNCPFIKTHIDIFEDYEECFDENIDPILAKKITKISKLLKS